MTLREISKEVSIALGIDMKDMISDDRSIEFVMARHIWRVIAVVEFGYSKKDVGKFELSFLGRDIDSEFNAKRSAVYHSIKKIVIEDNFKEEYKSVLDRVRNMYPESPVSSEKVNGKITRVTKEEFDERYYHNPDKINPMSDNHWFPSWHFLYHIASPTNQFLVDYYKNKGWFSDFEFHRAEVMGSYVHNCIEDMGKHGMKISQYMIHRAFPNPKEARKVEESLKAWITFVKDEEPQVLSYEQMVIAEDWGGTVDLRARIKSDDYKNMWTIDFKTSKTVYESHRSQVESYRRQFNDDKAGILLLGNNTRKGYTFTEVKAKDRDFVYKDFLFIKDLAYHRLKHANRLEPHDNDMPEEFSLEGLNITKL